MATTPVMPDPSQQPITAQDPRVAQILALIKAQTNPPPVSQAPAPVAATIPQQPMQNLPLPSSAPPPDAMAPQQPMQNAPAPAVPSVPQTPDVIPQQPMQNLPLQSQPIQPSQPGPIKSFLQSLVSGLGSTAYAGTQGALQRLGLPTDYEKQQQAQKDALAQQAANSESARNQAMADFYSGKTSGLQNITVPNNPDVFGTSAGQQMTQDQFSNLLRTLANNAGKGQVAQIGADSRTTVGAGHDAALLARAQVLAQKATNFQHVAGTSGGQNTFANYNPSNGQYTDLTGKVMTDFQPASKAMQGAMGGFGPAFAATRTLMAAYNENPALLPVLAPMLAKMLAPGDPNAAATFASLPNGQPQDANGNPIGLRMPGAPTATTRSRGQFASEVLPTMQAAMGEVTKNAAQLGPFMGRVSDLYTSKIGAYGPQYSALQTDLHNIATAWGRLHGNSVQTMNQFSQDLNSAKDPANLLAKLQRYQDQASIYAKGGQGVPVTTPQASPVSNAPITLSLPSGKSVTIK